MEGLRGAIRQIHTEQAPPPAGNRIEVFERGYVRVETRYWMAVALWLACAAPAAPAHAQTNDIVLPSQAAAEPATVDGCQVIARVDGQVVLACEVLYRVNMRLEDNRDKIPPEQYEAVRDQLMLMTLTSMLDQKLLFAEFRRNIPPENMPRIEDNLRPHFEEKEIPRLMQELDVKSTRELEQELARLGSSLDDTRRTFNEHVIASEWIRSKIKVNDEVSPEEMVKYYRENRAAFEFPMKARFEELMVRKSGIPAQAEQQYARMAEMGNQVWTRVAVNPPSTPIFADVAQAKSEGFNAAKGGLYDWTNQGSLKAAVVDNAIFTLPIGQMSPILDSGTGFHIVRVLERTEAGCRPFSEVQNDIREKLKDERMLVAQRKYLADLRKRAKVWTAYTGDVSAETLMAQVGGNRRR